VPTTTALEVEALTRFGRALADPTRCRILVCFLDAPHYPAQLADHLDLSRANVSNHLTHLRAAGLVDAVPEGRRVRYALADDRLAHALRDLLGVVR
jgi:DNA-binding transcriptional ArsR family regulator